MKKQPLEFYFFATIFVALILAIMFMCWQNIVPYHNLFKKWYGLDSEPLSVFEVFQFKVEITLAWLTGLIFWAVLQGLQVAYLLYTFSEKVLDYDLSKDRNNSKYLVEKEDSRLAKKAKKIRNNLPLRNLFYLQCFCLGAYGIEAAINYETYPFLGQGIGMIGKFANFNYDLKECFLYFLTIIAVEGLVFVAIVFYHVLESLSESGAYQRRSRRENQY